MPIFGQVWLWSLLAFLLGALLCWVLVVLPVRRRLDALESRLSTFRGEGKHGTTTTPGSTIAAERPLPAHDLPSDRPQPAHDLLSERALPAHDRRSDRPQPAHDLLSERAQPAHRSTPSIVPGFGDPDLEDDDQIPVDTLTSAYAIPGPPAPPADEATERGALSLSGPGSDEPAAGATQYLGALGAPLGPPPDQRDWFTDEPDRNLVDDAADEAPEDERATIFTQRTMPIPVELIRSLDTAARQPEPEEQDASLVDDLEDEPAAAPEPAPVSEAHTTVMPRLTEPEPEFTELVEPLSHAASNGTAAPVEPEVPVAAAAEPVAEERIALLSAAEQTMAHGVTVETERAPSPSALPKRIPSKPQHRVPFGVPTASPAAAPAAAGNERMRSLFEPMIPAEGGVNAVPPPPHRLRTADSRPSAPGPFGPGSAMPLPGGASPSPEFTVKASVTALRYCTPESSQFGRTVAEVWFRSAADAERVGFRPVG